MRNKFRIGLVALVSMLLIPVGASVFACGYYPEDGGYVVRADEPECNSIQTGIDTVAAGEVVLIAAATYNESVTIDKDIAVEGWEDTGEIIIDGLGSAWGVEISSDSIMSNLTIQNCDRTNTNLRGGGISIFNNASPLVTNVRINGCSANYGAGIYVSNGAPTFVDCLISENEATYYGGGLYAYSGSTTLDYCEITFNTALRGGGIYRRPVATVDYSTSNVQDNTPDDVYPNP